MELELKIQATVNALYQLWLMTNDPYESDFEMELKMLGIDQMFTLSFNPMLQLNEWILIR